MTPMKHFICIGLISLGPLCSAPCVFQPIVDGISE